MHSFMYFDFKYEDICFGWHIRMKLCEITCKVKWSNFMHIYWRETALLFIWYAPVLYSEIASCVSSIIYHDLKPLLLSHAAYLFSLCCIGYWKCGREKTCLNLKRMSFLNRLSWDRVESLTDGDRLLEGLWSTLPTLAQIWPVSSRGWAFTRQTYFTFLQVPIPLCSIPA